MGGTLVGLAGVGDAVGGGGVGSAVSDNVATTDGDSLGGRVTKTVGRSFGT